jgi:hypothetical protein
MRGQHHARRGRDVVIPQEDAVRILTIFAFVVSALAVTALRSSAVPAERPSTLADQRQVNVTIYNSDLALIHDRRRVALERGENRIAWRDVSANLDGTSSLLESVSTPGAVSLLEQNFDFDLLRPSALLAKAVGSTVLVIHNHPLAGQPAEERAKLLSTNEGLILQYADRIETELYDSRIVYTSLPPNLRDRPTLVLDLDSASAGSQDLDLSYLTSGLGWHAEYVGQVSADDDRLDLNGKVTLTNTSGTSYQNARLQLVAGNVNAPPPPTMAMRAFAEMSAAPAPRVTQENYFEYHLYTLNRPTTIAENQTKQVGFLTAHNVPIRKTLELRGGASYYRTNTPDLGAKLPVSVYVSFDDKGGDLGIPLPGGLVRLYKSDAHGTSQFLGADRIDHTPKNETVRLHVGNSFDVTGRKKQTNYHIVNEDQSIYDTAYEIKLSNAKDAPVDVLVVEPIPGEWQMLGESQPHEKSSSSTASWTIHVPADGSTTLRYSVRVRF